jgi:hypothetical protein
MKMGRKQQLNIWLWCKTFLWNSVHVKVTKLYLLLSCLYTLLFEKKVAAACFFLKTVFPFCGKCRLIQHTWVWDQLQVVSLLDRHFAVSFPGHISAVYLFMFSLQLKIMLLLRNLELMGKVSSECEPCHCFQMLKCSNEPLCRVVQ